MTGAAESSKTAEPARPACARMGQRAGPPVSCALATHTRTPTCLRPPRDHTPGSEVPGPSCALLLPEAVGLLRVTGATLGKLWDQRESVECLPFGPCPGPLLDHAAQLRHHLEAFIPGVRTPLMAPRAQYSQLSSWPHALGPPAPCVPLLNQTIPGANIVSFWNQRLRPVRCGLFYS